MIERTIILIVALVFIPTGSTIPEVLFSRIEASRGCEVTNPQFWTLINWFFQRTTNVAVTAIMNDTLSRSDTSTTFIRAFLMSFSELLKYDKFSLLFFSKIHTDANFPIIISQTRLNFEEPQIAFEDTFAWRGGKLPLRNNETHFRVRRSVIANIEDEVVSRKYHRKDEPEMGALVVVEHIVLLDEYLVGTARRPFRDPRKYYIIVVRHIESGWKERAALVMERLWKDYGVINALIMAPCSDSDEEVRCAALRQ